MDKSFKKFKHQVNSFEKRRTIWHQIGDANSGRFLEKKREAEPRKLSTENCILLAQRFQQSTLRQLHMNQALS